MIYQKNRLTARVWFVVFALFGLQITTVNAQCVADLVITQNVSSGQTDLQSASNTLTATNIISDGGFAHYTAGNRLLFKPGFAVAKGGRLIAGNADCSKSAGTRIAINTMEVSAQIELALYPNPTDGGFNVIIPVNKGEQKSNLRQSLVVYAVFGEVILSKEVRPGEKVVVDLSNKAKGMYLIKYKAGDQITVKRVLLK